MGFRWERMEMFTLSVHDLDGAVSTLSNIFGMDFDVYTFPDDQDVEILDTKEADGARLGLEPVRCAVDRRIFFELIELPELEPGFRSIHFKVDDLAAATRFLTDEEAQFVTGYRLGDSREHVFAGDRLCQVRTALLQYDEPLHEHWGLLIDLPPHISHQRDLQWTRLGRLMIEVPDVDRAAADLARIFSTRFQPAADWETCSPPVAQCPELASIQPPRSLEDERGFFRITEGPVSAPVVTGIGMEVNSVALATAAFAAEGMPMVGQFQTATEIGAVFSGGPSINTAFVVSEPRT